MLYLVHFFWFKDRDISCTNIVKVDNTVKARSIILDHHKYHIVNCIDEVENEDVKTYIDRGMPFIRL